MEDKIKELENRVEELETELEETKEKLEETDDLKCKYSDVIDDIDNIIKKM